MQYIRLGLAVWAMLWAMQGAAAHEPPVAKKNATSTWPVRKNGLWEVTLRSDTPGPHRGQTVQQCTSVEVEPIVLMSLLPGQENCREVKASRRSGRLKEGYDIRTVCYVHGSRVDGHMELLGDLQSSYEGRFSVKFANGPGRAPGAFEGRWLGACKPGQRPGDMVLPNGVTVNVVDDKKRAEAHEREEHGHAH